MIKSRDLPWARRINQWGEKSKRREQAPREKGKKTTGCKGDALGN